MRVRHRIKLLLNFQVTAKSDELAFAVTESGKIVVRLVRRIIGKEKFCRERVFVTDNEIAVCVELVFAEPRNPGLRNRGRRRWRCRRGQTRRRNCERSTCELRVQDIDCDWVDARDRYAESGRQPGGRAVIISQTCGYGRVREAVRQRNAICLPRALI